MALFLFGRGHLLSSGSRSGTYSAGDTRHYVFEKSHERVSDGLPGLGLANSPRSV
ncbi:MAG: hypothetical protein M3P18_07830 [Actinomycetota bacterium]|nr:hypothetical protein [Actinomycetota bacterium]